jgi:transmembrane sensor
MVTPKQADVAAATAWLTGKLIFNSVALRDVVDEFNRHTPRRLVLDDQNLGDVPISGIFSFTDSVLFIEFLRQRFALVVHETDEEIHIARR